jgi:hypothetical protein
LIRALQPDGASAASALPALYGKSITLSWSTKTFNSGARRIVIDFNENYTGCTTRVSFAKAAGRPTIIQGHHRWEVLSIDVISSSCSVSQGNVFGQ